MSDQLCNVDGCRLPALFGSEYCRQHLPEPARYFARLPGLLGSAQGANLTRVDLRHTELKEVELTGATLTAALLDGAQFSAGVLAGASLRGASARGANFTEMEAERLDASSAILTATR